MEDAERLRLLSVLVDRHYRLVYRFACRLTGSTADAEDVTQQAFLTAQSRLDQLRDEARAGGWLCAIARNAWLKSLRKHGGLITTPLDGTDEPAAALPPESLIDTEALQAILNQMPEEYRTALILFYFDEFSYKDIADHLGIPLGTVMSRLARGKAHLRRRLAALEGVGSGRDTSSHTPA
ncbi:MAG TPA: sigma-70 family RNA polymerase sigma factor [Planctomycetaceae bacterium]|nr:sigma-70 family RNA polymerase sigma factor [Planctomycetaceae bacterium]